MRNRRSVYIAATVSLAFHSAIFLASPHVVFRGLEAVEQQAHELFRISPLKEDIPRTHLVKKERPAPADPARTVEVHELPDPAEHVEITESFPEDVPELDPTDVSVAAEDALDAERIFLEKLEPDKAVLEALTSISRKRVSLEEDVLTSPAGRTPLAAVETVPEGADAQAAFLEDEDGRPVGEGLERIMGLVPARDITELIDLEITHYRDEATGEVFFEAVISMKNPRSLSVLPKEVVFLVDTSRSITPRRLDQVAVGIGGALDFLSEDDFFNIIAFKGGLLRYSDGSVPATQDNVNAARRFLRGLESSGQTNVERALLDIITAPPASDASYVVILTDGRPTAGMREVYELLQLVKDSNVHDKAIYCLGAGLRVERELLDFISFQNRGEVFVPEDYIFAGDTLENLLAGISYPVLTGIEYNVAGLGRDNVFPRSLTDLFRSGKLKFYGKAEEGRDRLVMEIYGHSAASAKKFSFVRSLRDSPEGSEEIARRWAFHKTYDLISRIATKTEPARALIDEVNSLRARYEISIPYELDE